MKSLKNIIVGFLVSFVGSIPLGYLNLIGFEVYTLFGFQRLIPYLLGVISVEVFVVYFTLVFAAQLVKKRILLRAIRFFSVLFMFVLAYFFYTNAAHGSGKSGNFHYFQEQASYLTGLFLSVLNFTQIPFWLGWNLYLLSGGYIGKAAAHQSLYILGTAIGTFLGMMVLILLLATLSVQSSFFAVYLQRFIIPGVFVAMGIFQAIRIIKEQLT